MALITCPECGKTISDKAHNCPHCGFSLQNTIISETQPEIPTSYTNTNHTDGEEKPNGTRSRKAFLIVGAIAILLYVLYLYCIGSRGSNYYDLQTRSRAQSHTVSNENTNTENNTNDVVVADPAYKEYYYGTWEYEQPKNQDGVKSLKFVVNPDKTVQAHVNFNGNETIVYGSWDWISDQIWMQFNDTEKHINGILYIDLLRAFTSYNKYFGLKYSQITYENDGNVYLYEDNSQAKAKNPNKRVILKRVNTTQD